MKCSISTYYKILDAELYNYDDGYMKLNADVNAKSIDLEEYASKQKKSIADMCNVPEEKVIPISRLEYETYADEQREEAHMYSKCQKCGKKLTDPESIKRGYGPECWNSLTAHYYRSSVDWENYRVPGQMNIEDFLDMGGGDNDDKKDMP